MSDASSTRLGTGCQALLTAACSIGIGSLYYMQPVLLQIAASFDLSVKEIGFAPMATQVGAWLGVLLVLSLGDVVDGRKLLSTVFLGNAASLAVLGSAATAAHLYMASALVGFTSVVPYLIPPMASRLVTAQVRGRLIGRLAAGVFAGMLVARGISGIVGEYENWRWTFWAAAVACLTMAAGIAYWMPTMPAQSHVGYRELIGSLWNVLRTQPKLRQAALTQGSMFAAFNVFWLALPLLLASPAHHLGSSAVAGFALVGLLGIFTAPVVGRMADRVGPQTVIVAATGTAVAAWLIMGALGGQMLALAIGVILLDLGTTSSHVANQTKAFSDSPQLRSRIGTLYVLGLFTGAAVFSPLTMFAWHHGGWLGVCLLGGAPVVFVAMYNFRLLYRPPVTAPVV
jgi:predicted MFS family arabinose efflux permease